MRYLESAIGKIHTTGMQWEISREEYRKIYEFFSEIWILSWVPMKDILACLAIMHHGIDIWEKALKETAFQNVHEVIRAQVFRICELVNEYSENMKILMK